MSRGTIVAYFKGFRCGGLEYEGNFVVFYTLILSFIDCFMLSLDHEVLAKSGGASFPCGVGKELRNYSCGVGICTVHIKLTFFVVVVSKISLTSIMRQIGQTELG